jgi:hypothetical protein
MKWDDIDWTIIRSGLLALVVALALSVMLLQASWRFHVDTYQQYKAQHARFLVVSRKYFSVDDDRKIVTELYPRFLDLHNRGIIGSEQRLNWYEVLRRLGGQVVPSLNYQILSRQPYVPSVPLSAGAFQVNASAMKLEMDLLHENDLARVLSTLEHEAAGLFTVDRCELQALTATLSVDKIKPTLRVLCELRWFSLTLANGKELLQP